MPWCPTCKNEYREGVATCADCGMDLVKDLTEDETETDLFTTKEESLADKFLDYLTYSNIHSGHKEKLRDGEEDLWKITVSRKDKKESEKLYAGFIMTENPNKKADEQSGDSVNGEAYVREGNDYVLSDVDKKIITDLDSVEQMQKMSSMSSTVFVKAEDKYKDHLFSAYTFLIFSALGFVFTILNMTGILSLITVTFSQYVMLVVFLVFFGIGIGTFRKANFIKSTISDENKLTDEVKKWLEAEITPEYLASLSNEEASDEENFFTQSEEVKEKLLIQFDDIDDILADTLIEEHLDKL